MKRFVLAIALACVLSDPALAGDILTPGAPAPGEIPSGGAQSTGHIPTVGATSTADMPTCGLSIVLTILDLAF